MHAPNVERTPKVLAVELFIVHEPDEKGLRRRSGSRVCTGQVGSAPRALPTDFLFLPRGIPLWKNSGPSGPIYPTCIHNGEGFVFVPRDLGVVHRSREQLAITYSQVNKAPS